MTAPGRRRSHSNWITTPESMPTAHGNDGDETNRRDRTPVHSVCGASEIFVYSILDRALCVADPFLDIALRVLRRAVSLELSIACRFSDAFLDLPRRLIGKAGNFVA